MTPDNNDKVPLFRSWNHWYLFVLAFLILLIILFSIFTKAYS